MNHAANSFEARLKTHADLLEAELERILSNEARPPRLVAAMRHAMLGGGKRLRPALVIDSAALFGLSGMDALRPAMAVELVHGYSLVHDDLPAMDNDDLRRGRPTVHRAFDVATAILAGDALLTLAFALLAEPAASPEPDARLRLIAALAAASGQDGMVGGQMLDLAAEGRFEPEDGAPALSLAGITRLQDLKTGALIRFSATAGALLAGRPQADCDALAAFGQALGLAFQVRDDLLDVEGDEQAVGKRLAKDAAAGKATFVGLLGVEGARATLDSANQAGLAALKRFGDGAEPLAQYLRFNAHRTA